MTDNAAIEAMGDAFLDTLVSDPVLGMVNLNEALQAALTALEAAGLVVVRGERVKGSGFAEWRANISPELYRTGDCVLMWVNEGDLVTAEFNAMIAAAKGE